MKFLEYLVDFLINQPWWTTYVVCFGILVFCGVGFPMPEDVVLFTMGYFAYNGWTDPRWGTLVCLAGVLIGDSIIFALGEFYGKKILKRPMIARFLTEERLEKSRKLFYHYGNRVIVMARFMPGLRAPVYFSAGLLKLPFRVFFLYDFLAAIFSVPLLIFAAYKFGGEIDMVIKKAHKVQGGIFALLLTVIGLFALKAYVSHKRTKKV